MPPELAHVRSATARAGNENDSSANLEYPDLDGARPHRRSECQGGRRKLACCDSSSGSEFVDPWQADRGVVANWALSSLGALVAALSRPA